MTTEPERWRRHEGAVGKGHLALVVDDCPEVRKLMCEILSEHGFYCEQANDAEQALELLRHCCPAIAVLDIGLPGKSGAELAWRIRERGLAIQIVAVSGQLGVWDPDDLADLGFEGIFAKPFDEDEFVARCLDLCREHDGSEGAGSR